MGALQEAAEMAAIIGGLAAVVGLAPAEFVVQATTLYLVMVMAVAIVLHFRRRSRESNTMTATSAAVAARDVGRLSIDQSTRTYNIAIPPTRGRPKREKALPSAAPGSGDQIAPNPPAERQSPQRRPACIENKITVEAGRTSIVRLNLEPGESLEGFVEEVERDAFDVYLFDHRNLARFKRKQDFVAIWENEGESFAEVGCRVPLNRRGPFYLAFSAEGKQYDREIQIQLETIAVG
jgi:hypothetical protein